MESRYRISGRRPPLRGRASERALLDDLISAVRRGQSRSLVLRGEAGIGKTALLEYLIASASDLTIVRAVGVESEMELAYASLHQLCGPLLDRLERLPAPQRQAMEIVFGMSAGGAPDRFLVGLAVLSLFAAVAEERPLLCVVDDAQWLDQTSGQTLAFVARRMLAEPVGIVFGAREPGAELRHMPELEVRGVRDGDARALLSSAVRFKLDEGVRDRIVAETRGNPLALLELPRGLTASQLAGGFGLLGAQALTGRIEESFVRRLEPLADDTRRLLLVAAAEPVGDPLLLWRAAGRLGIGPAAAYAAEEEGLLAIGGRVTFRHPLVRSAMYRSAAAQDRRAVHLALAEATDREADPDRRAWHLAAAAAGPDEEIALELERSAGRAQARGGLAAAAAFLRRAVALTKDPAQRAVRALAAGRASLQAGEFETALGLAATAEAGPGDEFQRAQVELLRAEVTFAAGDWTDAPPLLLKAAARLESFDLDLARETYLTAWGAAGLAEDVAARDVLVEICRAVRALPSPPGVPRPRDLMLDGFALLITEGNAAATPTLQRAVRAVADMPVEDVLRWGWMAVGASAALWDHEGWLASCTRQVQVVRDAGALASLPIHLTYLGMAIVWTGDFAGAASLVAEIDSVAAVTGSLFPPYTLLRLRGAAGPGRRGRRGDRERDRAVRRAGHDGHAGILGGRGPVQRPRSLCGGGSGGPAGHDQRPQPLDTHLGAARTRRGSRPPRGRRARPRCARAAGEDDATLPHRVRARHRGALPGAAERRGRRRRAVPRGHRAAQAHPAPSGDRPRAPPLRRMAAPRESPRRRARAAAHGARDAGRDRDGGVRRAGASGASGHGREGA